MPNDSIDVGAAEEGWPIYDLWEKYEDIAMHFNDLLMRLRTQALAGVAALTTIIGIFAKADSASNWKLAAFAFSILSVFWIAIWALDLFYYNQLLNGAVRALTNIEGLSQTKLRVRQIDLSRMIESEVLAKAPKQLFGVWIFYLLVLLTLLGGLGFSIYQDLQ